MRIAEYKQIDTRFETETITVPIYDNDGNLEGEREEEITVEVPVMGTIYRDATPEEEAECEAERRKAEAEEEERQREYAASPAGRTEAQVYFTAVMTNTLLEEE